MQDPAGPEVSTLDLNNYGTGVEGIVNDDPDNRDCRPVFCSLATEIDDELDFIKKRYTTLNYRIGDFKTAVEVI